MNKKNSHLPHIDLKEHYQFITFRTYASIDTYIKKLSISGLSNSRKQHLIDEYLDKSNSGAVINTDVLTILINLIKN